MSLCARGIDVSHVFVVLVCHCSFVGVAVVLGEDRVVRALGGCTGSVSVED